MSDVIDRAEGYAARGGSAADDEPAIKHGSAADGEPAINTECGLHV